MPLHLRSLLPRRLGRDSRRLRPSELVPYLQSEVSPRLGIRQPGTMEPLVQESTITVVRWTAEPRGTFYARFWGGRQSREPVLRHAGAVREMRAAGLNTPEIVLADRSWATALRWGFECTVETAAPGAALSVSRDSDQIALLARDLARLHTRKGNDWGRPWIPGGSTPQPPRSDWERRLESFRGRITPDTSGLARVELARCFDAMRDYIDRQLERRPVLIHGDVFRNHVYVRDDGSLTWIDLETVKYGLPEWDLGNARLWLNAETFELLIHGYEVARGESVDRTQIRMAALYSQVKGLYKRIRKTRLLEEHGGSPDERQRLMNRRNRMEQEIRSLMAELGAA